MTYWLIQLRGDKDDQDEDRENGVLAGPVGCTQRPRTSSMATPLKLNCWVLGEDSTRIFPVEIDRDKNVGDLKEAIKEKKFPAFDHITADSLDVWNVSIPIDEDTNLQAQVNGLRLHEKKPLWALKGLLRIFSDLDESALHVVIKAPPISERRCLSLSV